MRAFFLRELRRLAPISLGVLVLGALIVVGSVLLLPPGPPSLLDISLGAFAIVGVASAFLLGVATVAPDAESGAVAFLATLPVTRSRELAVRWGAALVSWGVAFAASAVLPVVLACAAPVEKAAHAVPETLGVVAAVGAAAFSAGAIGSMAVRRALVAVVVGPIFFLAPWFAYARLAQGLEAPTAFGAAAPFVIPPVLIVAAAFVFLRGDLHRSSFRPLALGSVVVGGALLLSCIATTGAFAYDRFFADWDVRLEAFHRTSARHVLYWKHREASWGKNARFTLNALDADTGRCLELAGGNVVSASPAGDRILVENYLLNRTELHELRTGDVRIGPPAAASLWQSVWNGLGAHPHLSTGVHESVAWAHGLPIAFAPGELQEWGKAGPRALPEGLVAEALAGSRVVLRRADGTLLLWDLERDLEHPERSLAISLAALPAGFTIHELVFSPLGGSLVVLGASDAGAAVYVLELGASPRGIRL
ncbi:hypothetical protein HY251_16560, partial [bacterium]|nr:hypothetical protein [bacterium]